MDTEGKKNIDIFPELNWILSLLNLVKLFIALLHHQFFAWCQYDVCNCPAIFHSTPALILTCSKSVALCVDSGLIRNFFCVLLSEP